VFYALYELGDADALAWFAWLAVKQELQDQVRSC
jgi:hypothetical protein